MFTGLESPSKLLLLALVAVLLFGAKRLPEIGRSLGHGLREFKQSVSGQTDELRSALDSDASEQPGGTIVSAQEHDTA
jgi:sec-independent protein translocase protein TatA